MLPPQTRAPGAPPAQMPQGAPAGAAPGGAPMPPGAGAGAPAQPGGAPAGDGGTVMPGGGNPLTDVIARRLDELGPEEVQGIMSIPAAATMGLSKLLPEANFLWELVRGSAPTQPGAGGMAPGAPGGARPAPGAPPGGDATPQGGVPRSSLAMI